MCFEFTTSVLSGSFIKNCYKTSICFLNQQMFLNSTYLYSTWLVKLLSRNTGNIHLYTSCNETRLLDTSILLLSINRFFTCLPFTLHSYELLLQSCKQVSRGFDTRTLLVYILDIIYIFNKFVEKHFCTLKI